MGLFAEVEVDKFKYIIIIFDHYTKYTKLYLISRATMKKILEVIIQKYLPEVGKPETIVTDHGTQFRRKKWKEELLKLQIRTYNTSVYHPSSNPVSYTHLDVYKRQPSYCQTTVLI